MEIKTIMALNAHKILKSLKTGQMSDETLMTIWKNIDKCQPIVTTYEHDFSEAVQKLQDEEFNTKQQRAQSLYQKKNQEGYVKNQEDTKEEIELNEYFVNFDKQVKAIFNEMTEKTIDIDIEKIDAKELILAFKHTDMTLENASVLTWLFK